VRGTHLISDGSFGVTIGKQQLDNKNRTISSTAVSSTVDSTDGNVSINACTYPLRTLR